MAAVHAVVTCYGVERGFVGDLLPKVTHRLRDRSRRMGDRPGSFDLDDDGAALFTERAHACPVGAGRPGKAVILS